MVALGWIHDREVSGCIRILARKRLGKRRIGRSETRPGRRIKDCGDGK
jgi:hypothetical protein